MQGPIHISLSVSCTDGQQTCSVCDIDIFPSVAN